MLIAGTGRRILITITGFTIAHSVTLAMSALGVVRVPIPPVEAAIALNIGFLAVEIVRGDKNSLAYRYPIAVSSSFGLLHGFGDNAGMTNDSSDIRWCCHDCHASLGDRSWARLTLDDRAS